MAIYHCSIKNIGRSSGRSAVASAAYRAGEKLADHETGIVSDYTRKGGVIHSEIMIPEHAPEEYNDREILWNAVQKKEKSKDARLAREVEVALPIELSYEQQLYVLRSYIKSNFVDEGMCADFAIHDKGDGNPHAHIMLTTRPIKENGKWGTKEKKAYALDENGERIPVIDQATGEQKIEKKTGRKVWKRETVKANDWNKREKVEQWRETWAKECNHFLGEDQRIDHRSYERQGIEKAATIHEGYEARDMERKGKVSDRCEINRKIKEKNSLIDKIKSELLKVRTQLQALFAAKEMEALIERIKSFKNEIRAFETISISEKEKDINIRIPKDWIKTDKDGRLKAVIYDRSLFGPAQVGYYFYPEPEDVIDDKFSDELYVVRCNKEQIISLYDGQRESELLVTGEELYQVVQDSSRGRSIKRNVNSGIDDLKGQCEEEPKEQRAVKRHRQRSRGIEI